MIYTVKQLSKLANVSIRTLHYYDEIGLLKPSYVRENGYRCYEEKELVRLQQILFFRELEFSLKKIQEILLSSDFDTLSALEDQKRLFEAKKVRLNKLLQTVSDSILTMKGGEFMSDDAKFSAFNDPTYQKYKDEVEERWGNTTAYKQSRERVGKMSKADLDLVKAEGGSITVAIADLMQKGFSPESKEVQEQVGKFYQHLHNFYDPSYEMFKGLGQMYVDDPRFTEFYEKIAKNLAVFMRDSMEYYSDTRINNKV